LAALLPPFFFLAIVPRETTVYGAKTNVRATRTTTCEILEEASGVQLKSGTCKHFKSAFL
jgi:hypothetical protein